MFFYVYSIHINYCRNEKICQGRHELLSRNCTDDVTFFVAQSKVIIRKFNCNRNASYLNKESHVTDLRGVIQDRSDAFAFQLDHWHNP